MIYPFPGYQNPVLAFRPLISCFCLLSLLLCCKIGGCRRVSPGSPAPQLTDLRSQISGVEELLEEFRKQLQQQRHQQDSGQEEEEDGWQDRHKHDGTDIQRQLQEVAVRPAGDVGEDLCNFNQLEDYIIRTKDSLEAGASFLKAPGEVYSWKQCLEVCCLERSCSAAVVERSARGLGCFLFDCIHRGRNVCQFSQHRDYSSFTLSGRNVTSTWDGWTPLKASSATQESDKLPISNAGQDVVLQLPVDWVILDGRESTDDHAIVRYEWTLLRGDPLVDMKVTQPGTLKLSHLQEGVYTLQLTVTDTSGQKSSDNVSVNVLPAEHHVSASTTCNGVCSRYQFICDDGCCIDITLACDRVVQCPDGSDEAFCQNFSSGRKTVIHITEKTESHADTGEMTDTENNPAIEKSKVTGKSSMSTNKEKNQSLSQESPYYSLLNTGTMVRPMTTDPRGHLKAASGTVSPNTDKDTEESNFFISKDIPQGSGHPAPETGAVLPLALGLAITSLLLLMVICRLRLVRQKLKNARPLTSEESDYLINGMYL
ncbi:PREDICTED: low-density lipoprotein receptor-related protein 11 isoform X2 [Nanorana parkeri]|uniref:low-density lipoprotein receptor-related protein 11 isoform X2 n=1 Tax=Nanorana parkeri TaxID=125878 RepID=UPI00085417CD|nr:PREDICTED: low-density lipoprotein receptor-related protein 11 isoform X2 [Nanorana parkeri]